MKILVAIDSSPSSHVVVSEVAARPWPKGSVICVLSVIDLFRMPVEVLSRDTASEAESQAADLLVKSASDRLARAGIEVVTAVEEGFPPTSIVEYADRWHADFIIVGSHGHGGISRFLLGSVAQGVLRGAHSSVEIVRPRKTDARTAMRILLATDGSDYSLAATRSIASRLWPDGTEVRVVSSVNVILLTADPWNSGGEALGGVVEEQKGYALESVKDAETMIRASGLRVNGAVLMEGAKTSIVGQAEEWGADLVVVGSHGRRGLNRVLLGSVSEAVAMHSPCSVDVIRMQDRERHE